MLFLCFLVKRRCYCLDRSSKLLFIKPSQKNLFQKDIFNFCSWKYFFSFRITICRSPVWYSWPCILKPVTSHVHTWNFSCVLHKCSPSANKVSELRLLFTFIAFLLCNFHWLNVGNIVWCGRAHFGFDVFHYRFQFYVKINKWNFSLKLFIVFVGDFLTINFTVFPIFVNEFYYRHRVSLLSTKLCL